MSRSAFRRNFAGVVAGLLLFASSRPQAEGSEGGVRPLPDEAFRVEWTSNTVPAVLKRRTKYHVTVTIKNLSPISWPDPKSSGFKPPGAGAVRLAYRWWSPSSPFPASDYRNRTDLKQPVGPGESATIPVVIKTPSIPGDYQLQFDFVQEMAAWFEDKGAKRILIPVRVE